MNIFGTMKNLVYALLFFGIATCISCRRKKDPQPLAVGVSVEPKVTQESPQHNSTYMSGEKIPVRITVEAEQSVIDSVYIVFLDENDTSYYSRAFKVGQRRVDFTDTVKLNVTKDTRLETVVSVKHTSLSDSTRKGKVPFYANVFTVKK